MTVALWRPDIAPPHSLLYPAILYQDKISTISPPSLNQLRSKTRIIGEKYSKHGDSEYQRVINELREAEYLQKTLGDLHVATSFGALVEDISLFEVLKQCVDYSAIRHSADKAVAQWNSHNKQRQTSEEERRKASPQNVELEGKKAGLELQLAVIEKRRLEARDLKPKVKPLRENLEKAKQDAQGILENLQYVLNARSAQKSQNKNARKESPEIELAQRELGKVLDEIKTLQGRGESISKDLLDQKRLLLSQLQSLGEAAKNRDGFHKLDSEINDLQYELENKQDLIRNLQNGLNQIIAEVDESFAPEIEPVKAEIKSLTREIEKIISATNVANSVSEWEGEWDFILEEKVGEHLADFLCTKFNFHKELVTHEKLWLQAIWGPKVILAEIMAVLADYFVQDKENWFTMGRTSFSPQPLNNRNDKGETCVSILQLVLPVPDPTKYNLEQIVEFRTKFNEELRFLREETSQLTTKIEQGTQIPSELINEVQERLKKPLGAIDSALKHRSSRLLVRTGAILRNPKGLIEQIKDSSGQAVWTAGAIALFNHDLVAATSLGKFSQEGAIGIAASNLLFEQVRGMKERRSIDKMGMRYLYELGKEFDVRFAR